LLAQSRQLLMELEHAETLRMPRRVFLPESGVPNRCEGTLAGPAVDQSAPTPAQHAELSIRVFEDGEQFGWRVYSPTKEMLGSGTAESEFSARVDDRPRRREAGDLPLLSRLTEGCYIGPGGSKRQRSALRPDVPQGAPARKKKPGASLLPARLLRRESRVRQSPITVRLGTDSVNPFRQQIYKSLVSVALKPQNTRCSSADHGGGKRRALDMPRHRIRETKISRLPPK
jgi:hypothetical protein